jgi:hypothetical protein
MIGVFRPDELETALSPDQRELKLTFRRDDGQAQEVVLMRDDVPKIIAELVKWMFNRKS